MKERFYDSVMLTVCRIPHHDEDPSDEFVEWLHENTADWSGDENGIVISCGGEHSQIDRMAPTGGIIFRQRQRLGPNVFTEWEYDVCENQDDVVRLLRKVCDEITSNSPLAKNTRPA